MGMAPGVRLVAVIVIVRMIVAVRMAMVVTVMMIVAMRVFVMLMRLRPQQPQEGAPLHP